MSSVEILPKNLDKTILKQPDGENLSYSELLERSSKMTRLLQDLGLGVGSKILIQADKNTDFIALYLASLLGGTTFIPINTSYTLEEISFLIKDSQPDLFICQSKKINQIEELTEVKVLSLDSDRTGTFQRQLENYSPNPSTVNIQKDDTAVILYTSGTTGKPKGAMLTYDNINSNLKDIQKIWGLNEDDTLLHSLPLFHIHGLIIALTTAIHSGATILNLPKFEVESVRNNLPQSTVFMGVPTMYHRLSQILSSEDTKSMRLFVSGSAPLSENDFQAFKKTGHTILERYGMTETGVNLSNPLIGERRSGTVGLPLPNVEVKIDGEEVGELLIKGPNVFSGYLNDTEKTKESFTNGWFKTGDLASKDADGYYKIVGRIKEVIITAGLNVYPAEVEATLNNIPGVEESAVIGTPDEDLGEKVTAFIVQRPGSNLDEHSIRKATWEYLAPYKRPSIIKIVNSLPRNAMGKVEKSKL